jgi:hypothetical protein
MSKPEVTLPNYEAYYDYALQFQPNQTFAKAAHKLASMIYKLRTSYDDGARDVLGEAQRDNVRIFLASRHLTADDQYLLLALAQNEEVLSHMKGCTLIPTEPSLQSRPLSKGGPLLRSATENAGAISTFRLEDLKRQGIEITPEIEEMHRASIVRCADVFVEKIVNRDFHHAGYWEGTRNRTNHRTLLPLKKGIGYTACRVAQERPTIVVPVSHYFGGEPKDYRKGDVPHPRRPDMHIGMPFEVTPASTPELLIAQLAPALQSGIDITVARSLEIPIR